MAKVIMEEYRYSRSAQIERTPEMDKAFLRPLIWGQEVTPEILANKPASIFVRPPEEGEMPDIFGEMPGIWTMSEKAKRLIEDLEPNIHTFIPIKLKIRHSERTLGNYYILRCGNIIDAIVWEETDFTEGRGRSAWEKHRALSAAGQTVLRQSMIDGKHLWRGGIESAKYSPPFWSYWFCSDELAQRIEEEKLDYWGFRPCVVR